MGGFSDHHIDSYEKKISVYQLYRMCQEGRLVFPAVPLKRRSKKEERVSETLEAILMGIVLPVIYASERQDGSLLVLDTSDRLQYLMEFLRGRYRMTGSEFYPELNGYRIEQLESRFPRITSLIYDYKMFFQVIEYTTPRYMHMQVGNYIEKWNFTREQGVRNELYGAELKNILNVLEQNPGLSADFFSRQRLNRQYMILRILMYRFVFEEDPRIGQKEEIGLQQLLDRTAAWLRKADIEEIADDLEDATRRIIKWGKEEGCTLALNKGKEPQAKTLGYLYHVVWMCREKGYRVRKGLGRIFFDEQLWEEIRRDQVTFINIRKHYDEIGKRLRQDAE